MVGAGATVVIGVGSGSGPVLYTNNEVAEDAGIDAVPSSPQAVDDDELLEGTFKLAVGGLGPPEVLIISVVSDGRSELGYGAMRGGKYGFRPAQYDRRSRGS